MAKVLVFDSGVGGLTILAGLIDEMPSHQYIYYFDNERYPYGELDETEVITRVTAIVLQAHQKHSLDLVVIACNTASTVVLDKLRTMFSFHIVGVVPALKPARKIAKKGIALIATPATVKRNYVDDLIQLYSSDMAVIKVGSTQLVNMAEEKLQGIDVNISELERILEPVVGVVDVGVLGCTHFPLIKKELQIAAQDSITFIDSGEAIVRRVSHLLQDVVITRKMQNVIYSTEPIVTSDTFASVIHRYGFSQINHFPLDI